MKTITLLNEKGGVGKTTLSVTLAALFAAMGYRTMLLDGDSQGHATISARIKKDDGLFNLLVNRANFSEVLVGVDPAWYGCPKDQETRLTVVPGSTRTAQLVEGQRAFHLVGRLRELDGYVDYVIIDTNPSISELHLAYYLASDWVIFPTLCARNSINGLLSSLKHLESAQQYAAGQNLRVAGMLGIVPTMFDQVQKVQYQSHGWLQGRFGDEKVFDPIGNRTAWKKAESHILPVFVYSPRSVAATEVRRLAESILRRLS